MTCTVLYYCESGFRMDDLLGFENLIGLVILPNKTYQVCET